MLLKDTKVYAVLEKFDKYEQNRCRKYLESPYFNSDKNIVTLYNTLIQYINKKSKKELTKILAWKKVFPEKSYDDIRFRKYNSDLLKLTEGYIGQQLYENDQLLYTTNLIKAVEHKKMNILYNSIAKNAKLATEKNKMLSANYFYYKYKIEDHFFEILDYSSNINVKSNYEDIMNSLDQFFLIEKLRIYCGIMSRQTITAHSYNVNFIDQVLDYVAKNLDKVTPSVEIYLRIYLTYVEVENIQNYLILKNLLNDHYPQFPKEDAYNLYMQLINYCIKKIRTGDNEFYANMFELYKVMILNGLIYEDGILPPVAFKNIISVSTRLKEFNWAENFIETNKQYLPEDQRENMVTFNLAMLSYMQKKHDKVIELLREVEYSDISLSLQSKTMLLMTYYDIDEFDPLEFLLESFRVYLNRHKEIPQHRIDYHKNLIKFTKKLTKIISGDKVAVAKIKQEIEATEGFRVKWLEEKIAELE